MTRASEKNGADLVRQLWAAVNRQDLAALLEICDEEVELLSALSGTYRGIDGLRSWWRGLFEAVGRYEGVVEDSMAVGNRVVLALVQIEASGQTSGMEGTRRVLQVFTLGEGTIKRLAVYLDPADALEDAARQLR